MELTVLLLGLKETKKMTKVSIQFHLESLVFYVSFEGLRQRYFGTGETFLFKFEQGSTITKYEWVNKDLSDDEESDRSKELFMSADQTMITVGGG